MQNSCDRKAKVLSMNVPQKQSEAAEGKEKQGENPLGTFGLPVQGHAKKAKSTQKHSPPQAPGAPWGGTLSTP